MLDSEISEITAKALSIAGVVDGIQASLCVTYRSHRPVYLSYVAAGCVGESAQLLKVKERLNIVCSSLDREWVDSLNSSIPVVEITAPHPYDIELQAGKALGGDRENLERALIEELVDDAVLPLIVDGSLVGRPLRPELFGVIKTVDSQYILDESVLFGMPAGWRSPRFRIPAGSQGVGIDRYSCYLRLFPADDKSWKFGLIRLESFSPDTLDTLAARALLERQHGGTGDARWDRHLTSVRACEEVLRAHRPQVYGL
jgi:hypothetical protein